ncbi:MAG: tRNA pseudouridine(55) synthase TruB [Olsenella sp.]|nr:tRNA pseudouridine(55) synthase TruB [Olsenella sp.]
MRRGESGINCLLAIDKPAGMSSHDVVSRVRRALGERRVGHAGTLDPAATGVLVVGIGQGTRTLGLLTMDEKSYIASIELGSETDTDDAEGTVTRTAPVPAWAGDGDRVSAFVSSAAGECDQLPPAYSAISVNGRRAYDLARSGEEVELKPRHVRIIESTLLSIEPGEPVAWDCAFRVSKGTYIRSLARDLGREASSAAHLRGLRRTSSGAVTLADCIPLDELEERGTDVLASRRLDPVHALGLPARTLSAREADDARCGRRISPRPLQLEEGDRCCLVRDGRLLGVWERRGPWLACVANFPSGIDGVRS